MNESLNGVGTCGAHQDQLHLPLGPDAAGMDGIGQNAVLGHLIAQRPGHVGPTALVTPELGLVGLALRARAIAVALPMPMLPPVTIATFPLSPKSIRFASSVTPGYTHHCQPSKSDAGCGI